MAKEYDNNRTGVLFKNDKEGGNPKWPDYKGQCEIDGAQFWLAAWIKEGKKGKFMSIVFKPKEDVEKKAEAKPSSQPSFDDMDVPF